MFSEIAEITNFWLVIFILYFTRKHAIRLVYSKKAKGSLDWPVEMKHVKLGTTSTLFFKSVQFQRTIMTGMISIHKNKIILCSSIKLKFEEVILKLFFLLNLIFTSCVTNKRDQFWYVERKHWEQLDNKSNMAPKQAWKSFVRFDTKWEWKRDLKHLLLLRTSWFSFGDTFMNKIETTVLLRLWNGDTCNILINCQWSTARGKE